jgi:hypothetical protein
MHFGVESATLLRLSRTNYLGGANWGTCPVFVENNINNYNRMPSNIGGEGGIRTLGTRKGTPDFESGPFGLSGTSPWDRDSTT